MQININPTGSIALLIQTKTPPRNSDGGVRAARADKEVDGTLKIGSSRLSNNHEQLARTKEIEEPARSDISRLSALNIVNISRIRT